MSHIVKKIYIFDYFSPYFKESASISRTMENNLHKQKLSISYGFVEYPSHIFLIIPLKVYLNRT